MWIIMTTCFQMLIDARFEWYVLSSNPHSSTSILFNKLHDNFCLSLEEENFYIYFYLIIKLKQGDPSSTFFGKTSVTRRLTTIMIKLSFGYTVYFSLLILVYAPLSEAALLETRTVPTPFSSAHPGAIHAPATLCASFCIPRLTLHWSLKRRDVIHLHDNSSNTVARATSAPNRRGRLFRYSHVSTRHYSSLA